MGCFMTLEDPCLVKLHNPLIVFKFDVFAKPGKGGVPTIGATPVITPSVPTLYVNRVCSL